MPTKPKSPWIEEARRLREVISLTQDLSTDVLVVGGGISGIATAYFLLTETSHSVTLIDASLVGQGASGRNAGQVVAQFDCWYYDIVKKYGTELAADGQRSFYKAWDQLEAMILLLKE